MIGEPLYVQNLEVDKSKWCYIKENTTNFYHRKILFSENIIWSWGESQNTTSFPADVFIFEKSEKLFREGERTWVILDGQSPGYLYRWYKLDVYDLPIHSHPKPTIECTCPFFLRLGYLSDTLFPIVLDTLR